jgi:hypothetical protein
MTNEIHYIRDDELDALRENIDELGMALEPSAIYGDVKPEVEALELLNRIEKRHPISDEDDQ